MVKLLPIGERQKRKRIHSFGPKMFCQLSFKISAWNLHILSDRVRFRATLEREKTFAVDARV